MSTRSSLVVVLALLKTTPAALAQQTSPPVVRPEPPPAESQGPLGPAIGAGIGLGLAGFVVGGLAGYGLAKDCTADELCQLAGVFYGAAIGGTSGMALGVHLGNGRRGSFALDFLTGAVVWGAGAGLVAVSREEAVLWSALIGIPIAQLVSTIAVERAVGRLRARQLGAGLSISPMRGGRWAIAVSVPLANRR